MKSVMISVALISCRRWLFHTLYMRNEGSLQMWSYTIWMIQHLNQISGLVGSGETKIYDTEWPQYFFALQ